MIDLAWNRRANECIAHGALTNSKRPSCFIQGVYPTHVKRGQGCWLWDHKGNRYLDFITGLGTNILGYAHTTVNAAISEQMNHGASLSLSTHVEIEAAEKLKELFPFVDCVRFLKTGSEACSAAVRIARGKTARQIILSEGFHGWHEEFSSLNKPTIGIYNSPLCYKLSSQNTISSDWERIAAIIIEPVITDWSDERRSWLEKLRADCTKYGVLLIFDEIITGFRWPKFSVASHWGIIPDLIVLGKAMANGMPLAAVGGKYDVMNGSDYFVSSTYAGEILSLAAAKATMTLLQTKYLIPDLWREGQEFLDEFNAILPDKIRIEGYPTRGAFVGDPMVKAMFMQEACLAGLLFGPSWFFNFPAATEWRNAMGAIKSILGRIERGEVQLVGPMPVAAIAQKVRGQA